MFWQQLDERVGVGREVRGEAMSEDTVEFIAIFLQSDKVRNMRKKLYERNYFVNL